MREILFRGKRYNGEWVKGYYFKAKQRVDRTTLCAYISVPHPKLKMRPSDDYMVDPDTVSEFTGLRDRNGKRIFEGDIINYEDGDPSDYEYHDGTIMNVGEIIFCDGKFCFTNAVSVSMDDLLCDNDMLDCEVIGNKWDNPELLEG